MEQQLGQQSEKSSKTIGNEEIVLLRLSEVRLEGRSSRTSVLQALIYDWDLQKASALAEAFFFIAAGEQRCPRSIAAAVGG